MFAHHTCSILHGECGPTDKNGCILPEGHTGPHEFIDDKGVHWLWETDLECTCEHCMDEGGDYCTEYWEKPTV